MAARLCLAAPDVSRVDTLWRNPLPYPLWPVGDRPLLDHWIEEARRRGAAQVRVYAPDRPGAVRAHISELPHRLAPPTEVVATAPTAGEDGVEWITGLPGQPPPSLPLGEPVAMLRHWFSLQVAWLVGNGPGRVPHARRVSAAGWAARGARIDAGATLREPFWIGAGAHVEAGAVVGPGVLVGPGASIASGARVASTFLAAHTPVPPGAAFTDHLLQGGLWIDLAAGRRTAPVPGALAGEAGDASPGIVERLLAVAAYYALAPAWIAQTRTVRMATRPAVLGTCGVRALSTADAGSLLLRRRLWLREVAAGRMRWFGPLPRDPFQVRRIDPAWRAALADAVPGVISIADLHDCDGVDHPDEWIHAAGQLTVPPSAIRRTLLRAWRRWA